MPGKTNIGKPTRISSATTTLVKTGGGVLFRIVVNTTAAGHVHVYDGLTAGGTEIATMKASIAEGHYQYDCAFSTGLCIVTDAASDITVVFE